MGWPRGRGDQAASRSTCASVRCLPGVQQQQGGRARYRDPPASGGGRCSCNAGYGFRSAPNNPVKSRPASVPDPVIDHVPSTPRGPSEWPFPTNSRLTAAVPPRVPS